MKATVVYIRQNPMRTTNITSNQTHEPGTEKHRDISNINVNSH